MINVAFASDDNFIPQLMVAISSLLYNNTNSSIKIYLLNDNISKENQDKIKNMINSYSNTELVFIKIGNIEKDVKLPDTFSKTSYLRLFLSSLLPNIERVLYLDCDIIVTGEIGTLYNTKLDEYMCAGSLDLMPDFYKERIGLDKKDTYINAGILLINLKMWREKKVIDKFIDFIKKHEGQSFHHDQGVINSVFKDKILVIPPEYNFISPLHVDNYEDVITCFVKKDDYYSFEELRKAKDNPVIIHFCNGYLGRPWTKKDHPYYNLYNRYVELAGVDDSEIYNFNNRQEALATFFIFLTCNKLGKSILKIIPSSIMRSITNIILKNR